MATATELIFHIISHPSFYNSLFLAVHQMYKFFLFQTVLETSVQIGFPKDSFCLGIPCWKKYLLSLLENAI